MINVEPDFNGTRAVVIATAVEKPFTVYVQELVAFTVA